jgi:hypothetical protein
VCEFVWLCLRFAFICGDSFGCVLRHFMVNILFMCLCHPTPPQYGVLVRDRALLGSPLEDGD